jgi:hypothetical protein
MTQNQNDPRVKIIHNLTHPTNSKVRYAAAGRIAVQVVPPAAEYIHQKIKNKLKAKRNARAHTRTPKRVYSARRY